MLGEVDASEDSVSGLHHPFWVSHRSGLGSFINWKVATDGVSGHIVSVGAEGQAVI